MVSIQKEGLRPQSTKESAISGLTGKPSCHPLKDL